MKHNISINRVHLAVCLCLYTVFLTTVSLIFLIFYLKLAEPNFWKGSQKRWQWPEKVICAIWIKELLGIIKNDFLKLYNFFSNSKCVKILLIMIWPKILSVNQIAGDSFMRNIFWIEKLAILCTDRHRFYLGTDLSPLYMTKIVQNL